MIRDLFEGIPVVFIIICLFALFIILFIFDGCTAKPTVLNGSVIDKHYKAEENSTGVGTGFTSSGHVTTVITNEHESEKFLLIVRGMDHNIVTVQTEANTYYSIEKDQDISYNDYKGGISKLHWSYSTY